MIGKLVVDGYKIKDATIKRLVKIKGERSFGRGFWQSILGEWASPVRQLPVECTFIYIYLGKKRGVC